MERERKSRNVNCWHDMRKASSIGLLVLLLIVFQTAEASGLDFVLADFIEQTESVKTDEQIASDLSALEIYSDNALLIRLDDDKVLLSKDSRVKSYPASLTKMMTAILAIELAEDLNEEIILNQRIFDRLITENASMAGFRPGVKISIMDLLYGVLLPSGAEASHGLAEHFAGSESGFVKLMNEKAALLGMDSTNFVNTTGLHHPDHYSTAEDMARLLKYGLKNRTFERMLTTAAYKTKQSNAETDRHMLQSTLFMKLGSYDVKRLNGEILGGKTGYTGEAGLCLASYARIGGQKYMLITMGAPGNLYSEQFSVTDAQNVYSRIR